MYIGIVGTILLYFSLVVSIVSLFFLLFFPNLNQTYFRNLFRGKWKIFLFFTNESHYEVGITILESTMHSYTIPADTLGTDGDYLQVYLSGEADSSSAEDVDIRIYFGSTLINTIAYNDRDDGEWQMDFKIVRRNETSQLISGDKAGQAGDSTMYPIPFSLEIFGGLGECNGLLKHEEKYLSLEFQMQDAVAGILKSDVKHVKIPLDDLVSLMLTQGWLGTNWLGVKLVIQTNRLDTLKDVPGMSQGRIELSIARKDVEDAEQFVENFYESRESAE